MTKRGARSDSDVAEYVRAALRTIDDPIRLQESPLARLPIVQAKANAEFARRVCAQGQALSWLLRSLLHSIGNDLGDHHPVGRSAEMLAQGQTQAAIARDLAISEEHFSRHWKPIILRLLVEKLRQVSREETPLKSA